MHINPNKAGLALGAFIGGGHLVWSLVVALGWGQALLDFIFTLHMIHPVYTVGPFDITMALALIVVTALIGYVGGTVFAKIWNHFHRG